MRRALALFCLLVGLNVADSFAGPDNPVLAQVVERLVRADSLQGQFVQEKHLVFLQKPFISSGEFRIDHSAGLHWQVLEPLASLMVVDGSTVLLDGKPMVDRGVGQLMGLIMFSVMEGRLDELTDYFAVTGEAASSQWQLSLIPESSRLKSVLQKIELRGDDYLREIEIFERDENRTVIVLSEMRTRDAVQASLHASPSL